jgi:hypothetical protein
MQILDLPVIAWIPIRDPIWEQRMEAYEVALGKLLAQLPQIIPLLNPRIKNIEATLGEPSGEVATWLAGKSILVAAGHVDYIYIKATVTIDVAALERQNPDRSFEPSLLQAIASMDLSSALEPVLVLSELAEPGCIDTTEGLVVAEGGGWHPIKAKGSFWSLRFPEKEDPTWPPISTIDFTDVATWASTTSFFHSALAVTRVERCLAAYTHMIGLTMHREGESLFRAMQALEAFYCDGTGDLRKQLSDKSSIWLGAWPDRKNIVGHLYDLRSKFVHGSSKLQYWIDQSDAWSEDEKHMTQFSFGATFAARLVVATLQKCVKERINAITWSYSVETTKSGP